MGTIVVASEPPTNARLQRRQLMPIHLVHQVTSEMHLMNPEIANKTRVKTNWDCAG